MKLKYFLFIILFLNIFSINAYSQSKDTNEVIKVGVYESKPYYSVDSDGNVSGYYDDLLKLLQKKYKFEYEYLLCDFDDGINNLENGMIDIMFGISITPERIDKLKFNKNFIARENYGLLTNKDIEFDDLKNIEGLKIGVVEGSANVKMVSEFFLVNKIDVELVYANDWNKLDELLENKDVDIILQDIHDKIGFKILYEFQGDQVYMASNRNKEYILKNMDIAIEECHNEYPDKLDELYNKYFNEEYYKSVLKEKILLTILIILIVLLVIIVIIPRIRKNMIKNKIKVRMRDNKYLLQYQPIYNPRNNIIIGFEALLRLMDKNNNLIPPFKFINEIEKNGMLFEITLWILKKVIDDYKEIANYNCVKDKEFYISLNLSLQEIENDKFVKKATQILNESNLGKNKICLEIIERVKKNDISKINKNITILKNTGFKIAIDDFGVEYSNLDILNSLDTDVIKVDKHFVDGIDKDVIKNEIILFISRVAKTKNRAVVLEGIEEKVQDEKVKEIDNDKIYVQGYFYSKPIYKQDIQLL